MQSFPSQAAAPQDLRFPAEEFRTKQPVAGAPRQLKLPKVKPFTLKNGIKVFLVEQHTLPIVSMDLNFDGGAMIDPKGKEGLASVCMAMLTEGTDKLDKLQYAEALADVASNISPYATDDATGLTLSAACRSTCNRRSSSSSRRCSDPVPRVGLRPHDQAPHQSVRQSKQSASVAGRVRWRRAVRSTTSSAR
jgi:zinc protease